MSCLKLKYFNGKGRAEGIRIVLAYAGKEFDDERIEYEDWPKMKEELKLSYGLPAVEIGGKLYCQSLAILQYVARKYGVYGETAEDQLLIDMIGQCYHDIASKFPLFEKDEQKKKERIEELFTQTYPKLFQYVEDLLPETGFLLGKECVADFGTMQIVDFVTEFRPEFMVSYPKMKRITELVKKIPNIAKWLETRPKTAF